MENSKKNYFFLKRNLKLILDILDQFPLQDYVFQIYKTCIRIKFRNMEVLNRFLKDENLEILICN